MVASLSCAELGTAQPQLVFMYSCSKSFRELKSAIKSVFPLFRGSGGPIKFLIEKNMWGKIFSRLAFYTWVILTKGGGGGGGGSDILI